MKNNRKSKILIFFAAAFVLALAFASFAQATVYAAPGSGSGSASDRGEISVAIGDSVIVDSHKIVLTTASAYSASFDVYDTAGNKVNSVTLTNAGGASSASSYNAPTFSVSVKETENGKAKISFATTAVQASQAGNSVKAATSKSTGGGGSSVSPTKTVEPNYANDASREASEAHETSVATSIAVEKPALTENSMVEPQKTFSLKQGWNLVSTAFAGATITTTCEYKTECPACVNSVPACAAPCRIVGPKLWNYDSATKRYDSPGYLGSATLVPGKGYWVYAKNDCEMTVSYASDEKPYFLEGLALHAGWNQIGGPSHEIALSEIAGNCDVRAAWGFDARANRYVKASVLEPGKAYFVRVARDCTLERTPGIPVLPEETRALESMTVAASN